MSYLHHYLKPQSEPTVKTHNSIESLINFVIPGLDLSSNGDVIDEKTNLSFLELKNKELEITKVVEQLLQTPKERQEIEKINEEINNDLKQAFINENVTIQEAVAAQNYYKLYRDKDETFECKISVEGTSLINSSIRLVLESDSWNVLFFGKIYKDGRCVVPLKKLSILSEGTIGKARLEVIIDDVIFVPWEETFIVEGAKKVKVEIKPQTKISVNMKDE